MKEGSSASLHRAEFPFLTHNLMDLKPGCELHLESFIVILRAMFRTVFTLIYLVFPALPAAAASSDWVQSPGGSVRLVTSGLSDDHGLLRGAVEIRLEPGWKTYWKEPGETGIPPRISLSSLSDAKTVKLMFPAPELIRTPYASWAGYSSPVSLPVLLDLAAPEGTGIVEGTLSLGICETICIPIEASFSFDTGIDADNPEHGFVVDAAFAALPDDEHEDFRVVNVTREEQELLFKAVLPENSDEPTLFLAGEDGMQIDIPEIVQQDERSAVFKTKVLSHMPAAEFEIDYTLAAGDKAISGSVMLPPE